MEDTTEEVPVPAEDEVGVRVEVGSIPMDLRFRYLTANSVVEGLRNTQICGLCGYAPSTYKTTRMNNSNKKVKKKKKKKKKKKEK